MNSCSETAIAKAFEDHESLLDFTKEKCTADILKLSELIIDVLSNGNKALWAGNGGLAADCQHLAAELVGRFVRVIGITTSGNSHNIVNAMRAAQEKGCITVGMTGKTGGKLAEMDLNVCVKVPSKITARIQEMHILIGHIVCDVVEENFSKMEID